jgi:hypothetical protein
LHPCCVLIGFLHWPFCPWVTQLKQVAVPEQSVSFTACKTAWLCSICPDLVLRFHLVRPTRHRDGRLMLPRLLDKLACRFCSQHMRQGSQLVFGEQGHAPTGVIRNPLTIFTLGIDLHVQCKALTAWGGLLLVSFMPSPSAAQAISSASPTAGLGDIPSTAVPPVAVAITIEPASKALPAAEPMIPYSRARPDDPVHQARFNAVPDTSTFDQARRSTISAAASPLPSGAEPAQQARDIPLGTHTAIAPAFRTRVEPAWSPGPLSGWTTPEGSAWLPYHPKTSRPD